MNDLSDFPEIENFEIDRTTGREPQMESRPMSDMESNLRKRVTELERALDRSDDRLASAMNTISALAKSVGNLSDLAERSN